MRESYSHSKARLGREGLILGWPLTGLLAEGLSSLPQESHWRAAHALAAVAGLPPSE